VVTVFGFVPLLRMAWRWRCWQKLFVAAAQINSHLISTSLLTPQPTAAAAVDIKSLHRRNKYQQTMSSKKKLPTKQLDDCCICLDKLSHLFGKNTRVICCGKQVHVDCQNKVLNSKMPYHLKSRCHHCRKSLPSTDKEHVNLLRESLDKDKAWAQTIMAQWYRDGKHGLKQSYVMATLLYEKAIAQDHSSAMNDLAMLYQDGHGVVQSFTKAAELLTMAVERGQVTAMSNLGTLYIRGQGVDQSDALALDWWTKAANEGEENAMNNLGTLYVRGQGVDQSYELARKWWTRAAREGQEFAVRGLKQLDELEGRPTKKKRKKKKKQKKEKRRSRSPKVVPKPKIKWTGKHLE